MRFYEASLPFWYSQPVSEQGFRSNSEQVSQISPPRSAHRLIRRKSSLGKGLCRSIITLNPEYQILLLLSLSLSLSLLTPPPEGGLEGILTVVTHYAAKVYNEYSESSIGWRIWYEIAHATFMPISLQVAIVYPIDIITAVVYSINMLNPNAFGNVIRRIRKAREMNQIRFADKVGIHQPTLSQIEQGREVGMKVINRIASRLGIAPSLLLVIADSLTSQENRIVAWKQIEEHMGLQGKLYNETHAW